MIGQQKIIFKPAVWNFFRAVLADMIFAVNKIKNELVKNSSYLTLKLFLHQFYRKFTTS